MNHLQILGVAGKGVAAKFYVASSDCRLITGYMIVGILARARGIEWIDCNDYNQANPPEGA